MTDPTNGGEVPEQNEVASMLDAEISRLCAEARPLALKFAAKMVPAAHVEDVAHDAIMDLVHVWRNGPRGLDPPRALGALVYVAVESRAAMFHRSGSAAGERDAWFGSALASEPPAWMNPERSLEAADLDREVTRAYTAVEKGKRDVHIMVREDGMSIVEVAQVLDVNEKTVRRWLHEVESVLLEQLKNHLSPGFGHRSRGNTTKGAARIESRRPEATGDIQ
jgi:RNA polymerase sigma factor (sigma-70 family)